MDMKTNASNESETFRAVRRAGWLTSGQSQEEPKRLGGQLWRAESLERGNQECANLEYRAK